MGNPIWKDYFTFTKKERVAVFLLLIIIAVFIVIPHFLSPHLQAPYVDVTLQRQLLAIERGNSDGAGKSDNARLMEAPASLVEIGEGSLPSGQLFYFDPNTLDEAGWKKLGVRDKTVQTIINYRNKGGYFKTAGDIRKIYGLKKDEADKLIPYVRVKEKKAISENGSIPLKMEKPVTQKIAWKKIDINTATAEEWKSLPGIGDVLSIRIVKFRNAVHGFKSVDDIRKTYGLPDSTYSRILPYLTIADTSFPGK